MNEIPYIYKRLHLDENGNDSTGRDRSGLAWGYLRLHGYTASFHHFHPEFSEGAPPMTDRELMELVA